MPAKFAGTVVLSLSITLLGWIVSPCVADVRQDVAALMGHVREHEVVDDSALRTAAPLDVLAELRSYSTDPSDDVRLFVLGQATGIRERNLSDKDVRQRMDFKGRTFLTIIPQILV